MTDSCFIAHLTDPHLLATPSERLHGWDVASAFSRVLADMIAYRAFDGLVLGGDLVDDRSAAGYAWLNAQLPATPTLAVAGNHDAPERMANGLSGACVHGRIRLGNWQIIGLNTHVPGAEHGALADAELQRLEQALDDGPAYTLIVLHHPPCPVGTPWIDAMGLARPEALAAILEGHDRCRGLLAGHVHQAFAGSFAGLPVWTTPSTMRQFRPGAIDFAEDTQADPGWRWLELSATGRITTGVRRVSMASPEQPG